MPAPLQRWTRARVLALPDDGSRRELVDGALLVTPAPRPAHALAVALLEQAIVPYVAAHGLGIATATVADLTFGGDELLQPDLFVLPPGTWPVASWDQPVQPLLVVEVVSPSSAAHDRGPKRRRCQQARIAEYWVVDLEARQVERWRPADLAPEFARASLTWQPADGVPPLVVDLVALFDAVGGSSR